MSGWARHLAWPAALLGLVYFAAKGYVPADKPDQFHWNEFARLPVVDGGRVKPLDTFARVSLQILSARQEIKDEKGELVGSAVQWLAEVWSSPDMFTGPAAKLKVFRVDQSELLSFLQLPARPGFFRYSFQEILPKFPALLREHAKVEEIPDKARNPFQKAVFKFGEHIAMYQSIVRRRIPLVIPPTDSKGEWQSIYAMTEPIRQELIRQYVDSMRAQGKTIDDIPAADQLRIEIKAEEMALEFLPKVSPAAAAFVKITDQFRADKVQGFNDAVAAFRDQFASQLVDSERSMCRFEAAFNHLAPFYHCAVLYVIVVVLTSLSWVGGGEWLRRPAMGLATATFLAHTAALIARMVIQQRPPVTNLYSSAIFIGWGCAGLLILLEWWYRNGIGVLLAGATGATTLVIAHYLSLSGDTLEMMQAVLDTNFWLATHVTTVTLGYTASFVAGFLGVLYILRGVVTPTLTPSAGKTISTMTYGVICFAMLLSFVGTVLGGIWADQSWGRFWGWDPKENGAVLIVIWNALILHARWAGIVKQRGMALLAVFGNIVTAWSWFGTNQLGVGLHSYGFTSGVSRWLVIFWTSMMVVMTIGMMPERWWWSHRAAAASPSRPRSEKTRRQPAPVA